MSLVWAPYRSVTRFLQVSYLRARRPRSAIGSCHRCPAPDISKPDALCYNDRTNAVDLTSARLGRNARKILVRIPFPACKEAESLVSGVKTACVKEGLSRLSAISVAANESHRRIREGLKEVVLKQKEYPVLPLVLDGPFKLEVRYFTSETADNCSSSSLCQRIDARTVCYESDNILDIIYASSALSN